MKSINNNANLPATTAIMPTIPITSINNSIVQIPTKGNDMNGIAACDIKTPFGSVADFGIANPVTAGSENPVDILRAAHDDAIHRAAALAAHLHQGNYQAATTTIDVTDGENVFGSAPAQKALPAKNNGGGSKPISARQSDFVQRLCQQRGTSPEDICGKPLDQLTGADADKIIRTLK
jgi:hypothetical protein